MGTKTITYGRYEMDRNEMEAMANGILQIVEQAAFRDGLISSPDIFTEKYSIILASPGIFSKIFDKIFLPDTAEDAARFVVMKNPPFTPTGVKE